MSDACRWGKSPCPAGAVPFPPGKGPAETARSRRGRRVDTLDTRLAGRAVRPRGVFEMLRNAAITGWGYYTPDKVLDNHQLERMVDTSDEWIRTRTGIRERRIAGPGETTATMCAAAARRALEQAQLHPADLDLLICATTTPDHL